MIRRNIWDEAFYKEYLLTGWYPPEVKPVRKGWYLVGCNQIHSLLRWNGKFWVNKSGRAVMQMMLAWRGWKKPT
jgi:hypothetical protein